MLTFAAAVFLLIVTPGPGVLSLAGVGSGYGFRAGMPYLLGLFLGTNLVALAVISGVGAIVLSVPWLRVVLMTASVAYLLYLAAKIAFAGSKIAFIAAAVAPGVGAGILLQAINPKAYVVNSTLFAGFPYAPENLVFETLSKLLIVNAIWLPIHLGWLKAGSVLHELDLAPGTQRAINIGMALAMLSVVFLAVATSLRNDA